MSAEEDRSEPTLQRLTQPDWCNAPQPGNWQNACMRSPGHDGSHAVRKSYRLHEAMVWDADSYPVRSTTAEKFADLWSPDYELTGVLVAEEDVRTTARSLGSHQRPNRGVSDDWLTPPEIVKALSPFDLDPCASVDQPWETATVQWTIDDDGLSRDWSGFVWCNPPFGPFAARWLAKLADHGNGIALVPARTETRWFVREVWDRATAMLFLYGRPHFHHPVTGERGKLNSGAPIVLVAYGQRASLRLSGSDLNGSFVKLREAS